MAELAHPIRHVSDPPSDHDKKGLDFTKPRNVALTVRSCAKSQATRAGKPCKDETLNVSVLEDIAKLFPEGVFLKSSAALLRSSSKCPSRLTAQRLSVQAGREVPSRTCCRFISLSASASALLSPHDLILPRWMVVLRVGSEQVRHYPVQGLDDPEPIAMQRAGPRRDRPSHVTCT